MPKVLFVIPNLNYHGAARQLVYLAEGLPEPLEPHVCVLGHDGPLGERLRSAGVPVEALGWTRLIDPLPLMRLRRLVSSLRPAVIHTWRPAALRLVGLAAVRGRRRRGVRQPPRLVASDPFPLPHLDDPLAWLDRWLLRRVDRVVVSGPAEASRCRRLGLPADRVERIAPGVDSDPPASMAAATLPLPWSLGVPSGARVLACLGPFEPHRGLADAVWAFDILRYLYDDLHLLLIGDGPEGERLQRFARYIQATERVHLVSGQPDVLPLLAEAQVVLVPSRQSGGVNSALEAMAAGRPVVASRLPDLAEVVADGETGYLVRPAEQAALARQTRLLLDDAALRERFGKAGRQRARECFAVADMVRRYARLYEALNVEPEQAKDDALSATVR